MTCRKCQTAMRQGMTRNVCYITGQSVDVTNNSCYICNCNKKDGIIRKKLWSRNHGGWLTSQTATENAHLRFGGVRSQRWQISVSKEIRDKFYQVVPEKDRRNRIDHAILVEIGEA